MWDKSYLRHSKVDLDVMYWPGNRRLCVLYFCTAQPQIAHSLLYRLIKSKSTVRHIQYIMGLLVRMERSTIELQCRSVIKVS